MFLYPFCNIYFSWALLTKISQRILMNRAYSLFSRSTGAASLSTMACLNSLVLFPWSECAKTPFSQSGAHPFGIAFSATSKFLAWKLCFTSVSFWIRIAYINRQKKLLLFNCIGSNNLYNCYKKIFKIFQNTHSIVVCTLTSDLKVQGIYLRHTDYYKLESFSFFVGQNQRTWWDWSIPPNDSILPMLHSLQ